MWWGTGGDPPVLWGHSWAGPAAVTPLGWVRVEGHRGLQQPHRQHQPRQSYCRVPSGAESCVGHCDAAFNSSMKCQCDPLCVYYQSCCSDYNSVCKTKGTRCHPMPRELLCGQGLVLPCAMQEAAGLAGDPGASAHAVGTSPAALVPVDQAPGVPGTSAARVHVCFPQ